MDTPSEGTSSDSDQPMQPEKGMLGDAIVTETKLFKRSGRHGTYDNSSLETTSYEPIKEYEGRHSMFFALQLDRGNISQALSDNMLDDLGLSTNEYNTGQTIFYLCFLFAELTSQLISKKVVASCQALLSGKSSFWACRALLGLIEGGFIPDNILYLSYWYTSSELPIRLSFFWVAYQATSIVSAFLAFGVLHMRGVNGLAGWRWLFALEGTLTGLIGVISWWYLPPSPTQTASRFRGKDGWFNEYDEKV
ncbi:uncharacterized protein LTR77_010914 [Saxophila tyrrhenica]|uniref:Major facilitator superfamily (MFS) profile domain-containing protein n=1 Tax=Saxophila tyrrhenica TaxID=1690608 RepID=A0AAV9NWL6_9PEZI|nr:hypothetical protein LTR77_010914 [Saxophila tyrrhenica]